MIAEIGPRTQALGTVAIVCATVVILAMIAVFAWMETK